MKALEILNKLKNQTLTCTLMDIENAIIEIKAMQEHEAQLKVKDDEINMLKKLVNNLNNTYSVGDFDFESYYAMLKEN